eukprot:Polyplicarium_translucidae@DN3975_c0_g1_i1.p1
MRRESGDTPFPYLQDEYREARVALEEAAKELLGHFDESICADRFADLGFSVFDRRMTSDSLLAAFLPLFRYNSSPASPRAPPTSWPPASETDTVQGGLQPFMSEGGGGAHLLFPPLALNVEDERSFGSNERQRNASKPCATADSNDASSTDADSTPARLVASPPPPPPALTPSRHSPLRGLSSSDPSNFLPPPPRVISYPPPRGRRR